MATTEQSTGTAPETAPETLGLVGVGLLGSALAERLLARGFRVRGFDLNASSREALMTLGGQTAASAADVTNKTHKTHKGTGH